MTDVYRLLAMTTDLVHATAMAVWGLGLPLLLWHRFERLAYAYTLFSIVFVLTSVVSHLAFGECILTALARELWQAGGSFRETVPFTVTLANSVAGLRPSARSAVLLWEGAVLLTGIGSLWSWRKARSRHGATLKARCSRHSHRDLPTGGC